jgi:hypothetical protein
MFLVSTEHAKLVACQFPSSVLPHANSSVEAAPVNPNLYRQCPLSLIFLVLCFSDQARHSKTIMWSILAFSTIQKL